MLLCYFYYFNLLPILFFFFFNDTATTEIYTLSLHDALPIWNDVRRRSSPSWRRHLSLQQEELSHGHCILDRKSTRLNSSHLVISYAVFCLKKKKKKILIHLEAYYNLQSQ